MRGCCFLLLSPVVDIRILSPSFIQVYLLPDVESEWKVQIRWEGVLEAIDMVRRMNAEKLAR
jgi:hypothetical protein